MSMSAVSFLQRIRKYPITPTVKMRLRPALMVQTARPLEYPENCRRLEQQEGEQCLTLGYPYPDVVTESDISDA